MRVTYTYLFRGSQTAYMGTNKCATLPTTSVWVEKRAKIRL